jgi:head-tail adaptor
MNMNAGRMNKRITIMKRVGMDDGQSGEAVTYMPHRTVWACITPKTAELPDEYQQVTPKVIHHIRFRYVEGICFTDRAEYNGRVFEQIVPPININERDSYIEMQCEEVLRDE